MIVLQHRLARYQQGWRSAHILVGSCLMRLLAGPAVSVQQTFHIAAGVLRQSVVYWPKQEHGDVTVTEDTELHGSSHQAILPLDVCCLQQTLIYSVPGKTKKARYLVDSPVAYLALMVIVYPNHLYVLPIHCRYQQRLGMCRSHAALPLELAGTKTTPILPKRALKQA